MTRSWLPVLALIMASCSGSETPPPEPTEAPPAEAKPDAAPAPSEQPAPGPTSDKDREQVPQDFWKFPNDPPAEPAPQMTQEQVKAAAHVTFTGNVACSDCAGAQLLVRIQPFVGPGGDPGDAAPEELGTAAKELPAQITQAVLDGPGDFSVAVPKGSQPVVLEVLVDMNRDGQPSKGERLAMTEGAEDAKLVPSQDHGDINLDVSDREWTGPREQGNRPGDAPAKPPPEQPGPDGPEGGQAPGTPPTDAAPPAGGG